MTTNGMVSCCTTVSPDGCYLAGRSLIKTPRGETAGLPRARESTSSATLQQARLERRCDGVEHGAEVRPDEGHRTNANDGDEGHHEPVLHHRGSFFFARQEVLDGRKQITHGHTPVERGSETRGKNRLLT